VVVRDVTEYRHLQERLARADHLAALGRVAANVAHEIRNPLAGLEGFARLLLEDLRAHYPGGCRLDEKVIYAAQQVNGVVRNLLTYARTPRCDWRRHDAAALVRDAVEWVAPKAADARVCLAFSSAPEPLLAEIDAVQFRQMAGNLILNAVEACPVDAGARVEVQLTAQTSEICLEVTDTGCGIPPEEQALIFEPFFTRKQGGIGLGLALCRQFANLHSGTIQVRSELGNGSSFLVRLPKQQVNHA
jgi:signal transduction histidine kinase